MAIFIPNENIIKNLSFGQVINKAIKEYVEPELKRRSLKGFGAVGIEILADGTNKIFLDSEVIISIEFKDKNLNPSNTGKNINVDLQEIKNLKWADKSIAKTSARVLIVRFNDNWWIWDAYFADNKVLEQKFQVTNTHKARGGGYLPLEMRKKEKSEFLNGWKTGLELELPSMWKRHITVCQRYRGVMVYDGNYFDFFSHAQELYVLGYYFSSVIICRTASEQALIQILQKSGKGFDIYLPRKNGKKRMIKGIKDLVKTCRDPKIFGKKFPINKKSEGKLCKIAEIANELVHPKSDLNTLNEYKADAIKCMDYLQYVIKHHLNFVKDTGTVSGYKIAGSAKRLK